MVYRYDQAPEPMHAEATHISPPCCVSTHRSRVVDPDGPPTFLDHREAGPDRPQMTSFTKVLGHPAPFPIESSPPPISACSHRGETRCSLAPCRLGSNVSSPSVSGSSEFAPAICSFSWSSPRSIPSKRPPGFPDCIHPSFRKCCNLMPRWPPRRWKVSPKHKLGSLPRRSNGSTACPGKS